MALDPNSNPILWARWLGSKAAIQHVIACSHGDLRALRSALLEAGIPERAIGTVQTPDPGITVSGKENLEIVVANGGTFTGYQQFAKTGEATERGLR